jgi:hypothetical protein
MDDIKSLIQGVLTQYIESKNISDPNALKELGATLNATINDEITARIILSRAKDRQKLCLKEVSQETS